MSRTLNAAAERAGLSHPKRTSFAGRHPVIAAIAALFVLGLVIEYWWLIVVVCVLAAAGFVARRVWRARQRRVALESQARAELAARADLEHQQYLAGESRGLYGGYQPARLD